MEKVHFLNAGQGDCIVIESGKILVVIDSNIPSGATESPLLPFLRERWAKKQPVDIDLLCISHPDRDHYDGLTGVLRYLGQRVDGKRRGQVRRVMFHGLLPIFESAFEELRGTWTAAGAFAPPPFGVTDYDELCSSLGRVGTQFDPVGGAENMWASGEVVVHKLGPVQRRFTRHFKSAFRRLVRRMAGATPGRVSPNEISTLLRIEIRGKAFFLTGDTSYRSWREAFDTHCNGKTRRIFRKADVVKAPHHGSAAGQDLRFWDEVLSRRGYAVISSGQRYNHPSVKVVEKIVRVVGHGRICCTNLCSEYAAKNPASDHLDREAPLSFVPYHNRIAFEVSRRGSIEFHHARTCPVSLCSWHTPKRGKAVPPAS